jgi:acetyltransferase
MGSLTEMLNPEAVALIGATEKDNSIGRAVLSNLFRNTNPPGYPVYPVNPNRQNVLGVQCFKSIGDVPSHVTLAVIITPAPTVPGIIEECGKAGVSVAVILTSRFEETDIRSLADKIMVVRKKYGLRVIGPNSLGVILPHIGLNATFLR